MRKKKRWKRLMALALSAVMLIPSQAVYAKEGRAEGEGMEAYAESRAADADGFEIEDGVLKKYTGQAAEDMMLIKSNTLTASSIIEGLFGNLIQRRGWTLSPERLLWSSFFVTTYS